VQINSADDDAKYVRRNESKLSGSESDHTDNNAIDAGEDPSLPIPPTNEDGGSNGQHTGQIIKTEHV
jgi:hypothetical protein